MTSVPASAPIQSSDPSYEMKELEEVIPKAHLNTKMLRAPLELSHL